MMLMFRALAGQSPLRMLAKAVISLLFVGLATLVSREGLALVMILIFTGVTGPTIRLVTLKMEGIYDRIIVSPVSKVRFFYGFAGFWAIAVLLPLVPAIALVAALHGPLTIIPVITGTVLAVTLGTLAGVVARGLSDAHLAALLVSALLIGLSLVKGPIADFIPYTALSLSSFEPVGMFTAIIIPVVAIVILTLVVSRS